MNTNIFVIDDYSINLKIAEFIIRDHGYFDVITTYLEAQNALEYIVSQRNNKALLPDVILLDLNMPVMDGWQFLDRYKEVVSSLSKSIDIYILSSSIDVREIQRSKQYESVRGFLTKPLSTEMIENIMVTGLATAS